MSQFCCWAYFMTQVLNLLRTIVNFLKFSQCSKNFLKNQLAVAVPPYLQRKLKAVLSIRSQNEIGNNKRHNPEPRTKIGKRSWIKWKTPFFISERTCALCLSTLIISFSDKIFFLDIRERNIWYFKLQIPEPNYCHNDRNLKFLSNKCYHLFT